MKKNDRSLLLYNVKSILKSSIGVILLVLGFAVMVSMYYHSQFSQRTGENMHSFDYLLYLFKGADIINRNLISAKLDIPVMYLGMALGVSYITGRSLYSENDHIILTYSQSRNGWLNSKVAGYMICSFMIIAGVTFTGGMAGGFDMTFYSQDNSFLIQYDYNKITGVWQMLVYIGTIYITYMSVMMLQIMLSLLINRITGFICVMALYIASVFINTPAFIGNGAMLIRYNAYSEDGAGLLTYFIIDMVILIMSYIVSNIIIRHKDIFEIN